MTRVLVIDDDLCVGPAIQAILNGEGCAAVHALDACMGIEMFESSQFDLVIVDIFMPGINGLEAITVFRERAATIPIVAMSGFRFRDAPNSGPDFLGLAVAAGAMVGLRKPFTPHQLMVAVHGSLGARSSHIHRVEMKLKIGIITMRSSYARFSTPTNPRPTDDTADSFSPRQTDSASAALRRAVDDASAAMAHELREPLTALLLYLHEIKQRCDVSDGIGVAPDPLGEMVNRALRATEQTCEVLERVGRATDDSTDAEAAVARGCRAIDSWKWNGDAKGGTSPVPPYVSNRPLTPREQEVLALIAEGTSNKVGGYRLGISPRTFEAHRAQIMRKFGARNIADLIRASQTYDQ